ncbi:hypothetical protein MSG28_004793 [Choristoneura fumiferana]|uniref:Uncharacterized protein n=1 Tax=Choristoneura fumiferana TaxID=7141 RepID=A0ACC0K8C0_CHOFU|nr:hypothetical protein MSG28_004793 [Choristoneura fumiferana]
MKLCALIILASASYALADVERFPTEEKPPEFADQEGCYLKEANKVFPYDTRVDADDGSCTQYLCSKSNNEIQKFSCEPVPILYGCKTVLDLTKGYPGCCPKEECDAPDSSYASAYAKSESGKPPVTQTFASPGAAAAAAAT